MLGPTGKPQAFALGSRGLGEVDSGLYLVLISWLLGLRRQAAFSGALLVHFHVQVLSGTGLGVLGPLPSGQGGLVRSYDLHLVPLDPFGHRPHASLR